VSGIWISALAMFLLVTAMPWTTVAGEGIGRIRGWVAPAPRSWSLGSADEHAAHRREADAASIASPLAVDDVITRAATYQLDPPVRIYLPSVDQPYWRLRSETQNRPRVRELALHPATGALLHEKGFADQPAFDKAINVGIAAHEGQLFGLPNQLLGLFTALGLVAICVSAIVMWWRRRPGGTLGVPAPRVAEFRIGTGLAIGIAAVGILLPVLGASVLLLVLFNLLSGNKESSHA
jgi:uncharacterized iron-regulated membrane protein